jgi:RNA polymerase subunit RPABC4/transcription elongation factor Spt4
MRWATKKEWGMVSVNLTEDEILLLDGKCHEAVQKEIDRLKSFREKRRTMPEYIARLLAVAEAEGELRSEMAHGYSCCKCEEPGSTQPPYLRGPKKGSPNPNKKTVYLWGCCMGGQVFCTKCYNSAIEEIKEHADLMLFQSHIDKIPTKVLKNKERTCHECKGIYWDLGDHNTNCPLCKTRTWGAAATGKWNIITPESIVVAKRMM